MYPNGRNTADLNQRETKEGKKMSAHDRAIDTKTAVTSATQHTSLKLFQVHCSPQAVCCCYPTKLYNIAIMLTEQRYKTCVNMCVFASLCKSTERMNCKRTNVAFGVSCRRDDKIICP